MTRLFRFSPVTRRRWKNFLANRRGVWSLRLFLLALLVCLPAEFVANDRPLAVRHEGRWYFPVVRSYPETRFGGVFETEADFKDPYVADTLIAARGGRIVWPVIRYRYDTVDVESTHPAPAPPSARHGLGTDDQGRDVLARVLYGLRLSILFGFALTLISAVIGILLGLWQGYAGGWVDLLFQRFMELWGSMPRLYILIIMSTVVYPTFFTLLVILMLFSWMSLVHVVRAETLKARNLDYIKAARALGMSDTRVALKHVLPNAMVAALTFLPFNLAGSLTMLTSLDFLGLGLPPGSPSLGELLQQGKANLEAPWLGVTAFVVLAAMFTLVVFIGEAVRDAFDPRKVTR
jgi:microcin C transport system permease protein